MPCTVVCCDVVHVHLLNAQPLHERRKVKTIMQPNEQEKKNGVYVECVCAFFLEQNRDSCASFCKDNVKNHVEHFSSEKKKS